MTEEGRHVLEPTASRRPESGWRSFVKRRWPLLLNLYIFFNIGLWVGWRACYTWAAGRFGYVEAAFAVQNLVFLTVVLVRRPHAAVDRGVFHQLVAVVAFFSGLAFMGQPATGGPVADAVSKGTLFMSHVLSALCMATLGRSFGILIALRTVKTRGIYGVIRHPMYAADILLRVGYLVSHFTVVTSVLLVASSACYVYRALLEERFLGQSPEYRAYRQKVKYRFIPLVF